MANKKSVNLLPEYLRTDKNSKFLASTIDQLIQTPQLERIDGFVGSKITPNYDPVNDVYINESLPLRKNYQLEPALVFRDNNENITDVISYDDLINSIKIQGGKTSDHNKILKTKYYSYNPLIDWDKLINYSNYFWLPTGPKVILVDNSAFDITAEILGQSTYTMDNGYALSNGMKLVFTTSAGDINAEREYIVEGVGDSIVLVPFDRLIASEQVAYTYNETFDSDPFDSYPFDGDRRIPIAKEYITINKASQDLNPWTRYNRWFHEDIIRITAEINGDTPVYDVTAKAERPIIEFKANIQLYNFGTTGKENVDYIDTDTEDPLSTVNGTYGYYVDGELLSEGNRVIFNSAIDETVREIIYRVSYTTGESPILQLTAEETAQDNDSIAINSGTAYSGTTWYFDNFSKKWIFAQQHTQLNEAPLFDLFDDNGNSYTEDPLINDFEGSKIFGYKIGTGIADSVLGFPLSYQNSSGIGSFVFTNFFMSDTITSTVNNISYVETTGAGYLKINNNTGYSLVNVWDTVYSKDIPIIEHQVISNSTTTVQVTSLDKPMSTNTSVVMYVNGDRVDSTLTVNGNSLNVNVDNTLNENDFVQLNIISDQVPNNSGYYETTLSAVNNPLNGLISTITLSELTDHVASMIPSITEFSGNFPGSSNLRDISNYSKYGTRLIENENLFSFSQIFLGKKEHNVIDATRTVANHYNQFKMNLLKSIVNVDSQLSPADALDYVLKNINKNKDDRSAYYTSDMLAYGYDKISNEYTVGIVPGYIYPLGINFDSTELSYKSVLVYLNDVLLISGIDYEIDSVDSVVNIIMPLNTGDIIKISTYNNTLGSYVPATPSKLGLYPKFKPEIIIDDTYTSGDVSVIVGHDGSVIKAYGDYRDDIILEFEKRIYNNIKVSYNPDIFDIKAVMPGAFRNSNFSLSDAIDILRKDFITWAGSYNVNYEINESFDISNPFTFNYNGSVDVVNNELVSGSWKALYIYFYDTFRPHTHPWEMLGFDSKPTWWDTTYGVAPYTSSNSLLWTDLENGYIRETDVTNSNYARPGLSAVIPVDSAGNLKSPDTFLVSENSYQQKASNWAVGDYGPAETSWRRSSYWPYVMNIIASLFDPLTYTSNLYDVSRTTRNKSDQIVYNGNFYLNPKNIVVDDQISGYGNFVLEVGKQKDLNYISKFKQDIDFLNFNLFHKLGGFASKEKLQIVIDSVDPTSNSKGAILPPEDYKLILNVSNPVKESRISGIIVQKSNGKFKIKGYDKANPYFEIFKPIKTASSGAVTVGGVSESFTDWSNVVNNGGSSAGTIDTTSASTNTTRYYKQGQVVRYNGTYYRVKVGHTAQPTFDATLFQKLSGLPVKGGASAQLPAQFATTSTKVPYGTEYNTIQEVYDLIVGYGEWLKDQGFIFDELSNDLGEILDWRFTGKEFLYWTTQNWSNGNLITLSPFAETLKYSFTDSIVDDISGNTYEYNLLKADGTLFPKANFSLNRDDGVCTIRTIDTEEGLFFAVLNLVQKEHAMIFNNSTIFNDTIYNIETGYKQQRVKLSGFRTANWNGDLYNPGFIYDSVTIKKWQPNVSYIPGEVVTYNGSFYEADVRIVNDGTFDFNKWIKLPEKPVAELLPNFDYKINQFEDFYSLDIDNFDSSQQQLSQHLLGYTPRTYLNNIFTNPITQYKFYQGFIREKGTKNAIDKISKVGLFTRKGSVDFNEEWAIRAGHFGGFDTYQEFEFALEEGTALENPYIVKFTDAVESNPNSLINYTSSTDMLIKPDQYIPESTFPTYSSTGFDDTNLELTIAGYVRPDDVTYTAYNKNSLLDIANNAMIKEKETVWLGFLENGDWTVYRYTRQLSKISGVYVNAPGASITFTCDSHHNLAVGDIISVVAFNDQVNGVYVVQSIPKLNQFSVASELTTIVNEDLLAYGSLFRFEEVRYSSIEELAQVPDLIKLDYGEKVWIDRATEKWAVYEKIKNYTTGTGINSPASPSGQELGHTIYASDDSNVVMVSATSFELPSYQSKGRVWVYERRDQILNKKYEYILNSNGKFYCDPASEAEFGYSLNFDIAKGLYIVGAPGASNVYSDTTGNVVYSSGTGTTKSYTSEGVVKISSKNSSIDDEITERVLVAPYSYSDSSTEANYLRFGHSIYITQEESSTSTTLLIGAPGDGVNHTDTGKVFAYYLNTTTTTPLVDIVEHPSGILLSSDVTLSSQDRWGESISGSNDGNFIAITAPGYTSTTTGLIQIFDKDLSHKQTIFIASGTTDVIFGEKIYVSSTGKFLFASYRNASTGESKVYVYIANELTASGTYTLRQVINNPVLYNDLVFGKSISISSDENNLIVGALGTNRSGAFSFDLGSKTGETTFDEDTTTFISPISDAGTAYVFSNLGDYFIQSEELSYANIITGSRFGFSVSSLNNLALVGAPWYETSSADDDSTFFQFNKIDTSTTSWKLISSQPELVNVSKIKRSILIDSHKEEIVEYLDIFDPVKGKIPGIAEQELKYKAAADPAIYSIGVAGTVNDTESSWIDDHVGELWWDLSTAKYIWYEQSNDIFRKNNWGKLFPGASIDVYEWVKTDLLPTEWAAQADTNEGLTKGISGQPKYPDNSVISVKQVFNNVTNSFENVYFYWVKNKVTVPETVNRRISSYQVASLITDPAANGLKFIEILSPGSVAYANVQPLLVGNTINANISLDTIDNKIPRHTEWLIMEEGSNKSMPTTLLNKKLFDSLLGHDINGKLVPDPTLSYRTKYGIGIRPQQSMFKDRLEALRNLVEFANSILINEKITGNYNFDNLNQAEDIPDEFSREYDLLVEDLFELGTIVTDNFLQGKLSCTTNNGKVVSVSIINQGFGYSLPPSVEIVSDTGSGAVIITEIDSFGRIVNATVSDPGSSYTESEIVCYARPHSVIVKVNEDYGNRWTKHYLDYTANEWIRIKTQSFNTPLYWNYVDWVSSSYNGYKDYSAVIDDSSQLSSVINVLPGDYVKINNIGDGRFVVLEKIDSNSIGDFSTSYNIVYSQNGTIQISDEIWNYLYSNYSYDSATYEETLYDQIPDLELFYILTALKDDIFIKDLKINWNLFFFKAVKYALTEQKLLDWAFKTSFINIVNTVGELDQRSVYSLDNEKYFEDYVKEVKPYRTKIRSYTSNYTTSDIFGEFGESTTDFDLPSYFSSLTNSYEIVTLDSDLVQEYPWKWWADNYKYYVSSIEVALPGSGYTSRPNVEIVTAEGDTGSGATAEAYIRAGQLYKILVTNPGSGYTVAPRIVITGGGSGVTHGSASVIISNDYIRKNKIGIKFDRVGVDSEIGNTQVVETFDCSGIDTRFRLTWLAEPNKVNIVPTLDGKLVLASDYTIEYNRELINGLTRQYCEFVFLNNVPASGQIFKITYNKNINLYKAVDRINEHYVPDDNMPGLELPLLMQGAEYGNTQIQGLSFGYSLPWNYGFYNSGAWSDIVNYYKKTVILEDVLYGGNSILLDSVEGISVGDHFQIATTDYNYFREGTIVDSVNTADNRVFLTDLEVNIRKATAETLSTDDGVLFQTRELIAGQLRVGDRIDITGIDATGVTNYDGSWFVTGVGDKRFIAIGTGTTAGLTLSTSTVKNLASATGYVSCVLENIPILRMYEIYSFVDTVSAEDALGGDWLELTIPNFKFNDICTIVIKSTSYGSSDLSYDGTVSTTTERYKTTENTDGSIKLEVYNIGATTYTVSFYEYPIVEFWKNSFNTTGVDTEISAGSWDSTGNFVGALGINPSDLTVSGGAFVDGAMGFAPEEYVKGNTYESVGISVFTHDSTVEPVMISGTVPVFKDEVSVIKLGMPLEETVSIMLNYNGLSFDRVTTPPDPEISGPYYSTFAATPTGDTGATKITTTYGADTASGPFDLGFTWNMFGTEFTEVYVGTNGYLTFGGGDSLYTPLNINALSHASIMVEYTDWWQDLGTSGQALSSGQTPGYYTSTGTVGSFTFWRLRYQGTHYNRRGLFPTVPSYEFEVTLYSDGTHQYVVMLYENTWKGTNYNGDVGFVTGISGPFGSDAVQVPYVFIDDNSSHVFYSKADTGMWSYVGKGRFSLEVDPYTFTDANQFFVRNDTLYVAPQETNGRAGYTLMTLGGDYIIDSKSVATVSETSATVISNANINDVAKVYVTVDSIEVDEITTTTDYGYMLTPVGVNNNRAAVTVYNLTGNNRTIQAWFMKSTTATVSSMYEEYFDIPGTTSTLTLSKPLPTLEPRSAQIFIEELVSETDTKGRIKLTPPDVTYYEVVKNVFTYNIDTVTRPSGTFSLSNVRVYGNGVLLDPGFDYSIDVVNSTITLVEGVLPAGSALAIENLLNFDYILSGNTVIFSAPVTLKQYKVTSFIDNNGMMVRTEQFGGDASRRFMLTIPVMSSSYIWATVNGRALESGFDFELLEDNKTVQFSTWVDVTEGDVVSISYVTTPLRNNITLGYRLFKDMFGRDSYSRITEFYSTRLSSELNVTDTEIHVEDSSKLVPPNPARNIPGVVFIDSERIEFFSIKNNVLSELRRGTMGTGPANFTEKGVKLIDQGPQQMIPYSDQINKQYHITSSTTGTYVLNTVTAVNNVYKMIISSSDFVMNTGTVYQSGGDGISLETNYGLDQYLSDQVIVKFGGRVLKKSTSTVHNSLASYDTTNTSLIVVDPEFTINYNTTSGNFELNIAVDDFAPGVRIDIEQKLGTVWTATESLLTSDAVQARFLRLKPAGMPDFNYYGGNPVLTDDLNFTLTDDNNNPLEGY